MAVNAFGTLWEISTNGGTTWVSVGHLTDIGILDAKADTIETTTHSSAEGWRTFMGGLKDGGELKFTVNYDPAAHGALYDTLGDDGVKHRVTLTDAGNAVVTFDGITTGFSTNAPHDDKLSADVSVKVSGKPVITP